MVHISAFVDSTFSNYTFDIWRRNPSNKSKESAPAKWHLVRLYSGCFPSRLICHPITDNCTWSREPQMNGRWGGGRKKAHQLGCRVAGICVCAALPSSDAQGNVAQHAVTRSVNEFAWGSCIHRQIITEPKEGSSAVSKEVDMAQLHTTSLMHRVFHHLITQQLENSKNIQAHIWKDWFWAA